MRNRFGTRQILLRSKQQAETAIQLIGNLPLDQEHPLEILIREQVKQRGIDQNGLYWKRVGEIADQAWIEGRQYSKDAWHEYFRHNVLPDWVETRDGEMKSKWTEVPFGNGSTVITTTALSKGFFAEYTEMVMAFGAGLGVRFSARDI